MNEFDDNFLLLATLCIFLTAVWFIHDDIWRALLCGALGSITFGLFYLIVVNFLRGIFNGH